MYSGIRICNGLKVYSGVNMCSGVRVCTTLLTSDIPIIRP